MRSLPRFCLKAGRDGIALVITLGILASLVLLVFSMSVFLRTERLAARNFAEITRSRRMARAVLNLAIDDINRRSLNETTGFVTNSFWVNIGDVDPDLPYEDQFCEDLLFGQFFASESSRSGGTSHYISREDRLDFEAYEFPFGQLNTPSGELVGIYSYLVLNENDKFDINAIPENHVDSARNDVSGIHFAGLPGMVDQASIAGNENAVMIYNQAELKFIQRDGLAGTDWDPVDDYFTPWSRFAQQYEHGGEVHDRVNLNADHNDLAARIQDIERALEHAGLDAGLTGQVAQNIVDYANPSRVPQGNYVSAAVPMLNEAALILNTRRYLDGAERRFAVTADVVLEVWYPFEPSMADTYSINANVDYNFDWPERNEVPIPGADDSIAGLTYTNFFLYTNRLQWTYSQPFDDDPPDFGEVTVSIDVSISNGGVVNSPADIVFENIALPMPDGDSALPGEVASSTNSFSVNDPRLNYLSEAWVPGEATIGALNHNFDPGINTPPLFVRHGPIQNVAELGFIGLADINSPWGNINIGGDTDSLIHDVLDVFTVHTNNYLNNIFTHEDIRYVHGLANLNAQSPNTLGAVFFGIRPESFPGEASAANTLTLAQARVLAQEVIDNGPYQTKSDFVNSLEDILEAMPVTDSWTESKSLRESFLRQTADLLDAHGQTFTIILKAKAVRDQTPGVDMPLDEPNQEWDGREVDIIRAQQHAVAHVWRNPLTQEVDVIFFKFVGRAGRL